MNTELLFFILTSAIYAIATIIYAWQDKLVVDEIQKQRDAIREFDHHPKRSNLWKVWGNTGALYEITVIDLALIIFQGWWWAFFWIPIHWLLWSAVHDTFTGKWIMNDWWHVSSDRITQFFARILQQSGGLMFFAKIGLAIFITLIYLRFLIHG